MPLLQVVTNVVLLPDQKVALAQALQEPISTQLRIPVSHVHVHITDGAFLSYGGDHVTPAAYITCKAAKLQIGEESRKHLVSSYFTPLLQERLGSDPSRITTYFTDIPVENIAVGSNIMVFSGPKSPATSAGGAPPPTGSPRAAQKPVS